MAQQPTLYECGRLDINDSNYVLMWQSPRTLHEYGVHQCICFPQHKSVLDDVNNGMVDHDDNQKGEFEVSKVVEQGVVENWWCQLIQW